MQGNSNSQVDSCPSREIAPMVSGVVIKTLRSSRMEGGCQVGLLSSDLSASNMEGGCMRTYEKTTIFEGTSHVLSCNCKFALEPCD